ncbi:MAG: energy-converting hydrogenase B subunit J [Methanobrevibacter sp.]|jgi:energy-converting hydrogenase B subunit J|nr:energy-converting hydrogenase B subunit J [Candidatus Methanovirga meridionalis]
MLNLGPIIAGFIIGFIIGLTIKNNPDSNIVFTKSSFIIMIIVAIIVSWQLGSFPYYNDLPIATGFIFGAFGLIAGKEISNL